MWWKIAALSLLLSNVYAETVILTPSKDNSLYESADGSLSNGKGDFLFAGKTRNGDIRRALLAFPITDSIPTGATINSVSLTLHLSKSVSSGESLSLHRMTRDWGEGNSNASGQEGGGTAAQTGDATWLHAS